MNLIGKYQAIAAVALLAQSCQESVLQVTDRSFRCEAAVHADSSGTDPWRLTLELVRGDADREYQVEYELDGQRSWMLQDGNGNTLPHSFIADFSVSRVQTFILPSPDSGEHSVSLSVSTPDCSESHECRFDVAENEAPALEFSARADTEGSSTRLLVNIINGEMGSIYELSGIIDGSDSLPCRKVRADGGFLSATLPVLRPGSHTMTVELSDEMRSSERDIEFAEPMRYPELKLVMDAEDDYLTCYSMENPYESGITMRIIVTMKGRVTYIPDGRGGRTETAYTEEIKTEEYDFVPEEAPFKLMDIWRLKEKIESKYEITHRKEWDSSNEGSWILVPDGKEYYSVYHMDITLTAEPEIDSLGLEITEQYKKSPENYWFGEYIEKQPGFYSSK